MKIDETAPTASTAPMASTATTAPTAPDAPKKVRKTYLKAAMTMYKNVLEKKLLAKGQRLSGPYQSEGVLMMLEAELRKDGQVRFGVPFDVAPSSSRSTS